MRCVVFLIGLLVAWPVIASPPAPFRGENYFQRIWGVVQSKRIVERRIGTSDTTAEDRKFLEVTLRIEHAEIVRVIEGEEPVTSPDYRPARPPDGRKEQFATFYFEPGTIVRDGERVLVTTRTQKAVSEGWTSSLYGATFKSLEPQP